MTADRYRLDRRQTWTDLAAVVELLAASGADHPHALAALGPSAIEQMIDNFDGKAARAFWRAARMESPTASPADHLVLAPASFAASTL